jgi:hypothetical protein
MKRRMGQLPEQRRPRRENAALLAVAVVSAVTARIATDAAGGVFRPLRRAGAQAVI